MAARQYEGRELCTAYAVGDCREIELKPQAVSRALRELREAGYVAVEKAPDGQRVIFVDPRRAFASGGTAQRRATVHYLKAAPSVAMV